MPAIAIASLTSSILSAVANASSHAAASSSSGKSAAAKQPDAHKDSTDPANLANAFLACLATAVAGVPATTQAAISGTGAVSANASAKSIKGIQTATASTPSSDKAAASAPKSLAVTTPLAALSIAPAASTITPAKPLPMAATAGTTANHPTAQPAKAAIVPNVPGTAGTIAPGVPAVSHPSLAGAATPAANKEQPGPTNTLPALLNIRVPTLPQAPEAANVPSTPNGSAPTPPAIRSVPAASTGARTDTPLSPSVGEPRELGLPATLGVAAAMKPFAKIGAAFTVPPSPHDERSETQQQSAAPVHALHESPASGALAAPAATSSPAAPSSVASPPPPIADQLAQAFVDRADVVNHEGRTDFHLRLEPPQLGTVQIHLTATDHTISARVVVAQEGTRQLIEGQADQLRQSLANAGLSLTGFDVTHHGGGSSGGRQNPEPPMPLVFSHTASLSRPTPVVKLATRSVTNGIDILA